MRKRQGIALALVMVLIMALVPPPIRTEAASGDYRMLEFLPAEVSLGFPEFVLRSVPGREKPIYTEAEALDYPEYWDIRRTVEEITKGKADDDQKARTITAWLSKSVIYNLTFTGAESTDPFTVYTERKTICIGYTGLAVLMFYFAGIPAMELVGAATGYGDNGYHTWCGLYIDGEWVYCDPTWGLYNIQARYHKSVDGLLFKDGYFTVTSQVYEKSKTDRAINVTAKLVCPKEIAEITLPADYPYFIDSIRGAGLVKVIIPDQFRSRIASFTNVENKDLPRFEGKEGICLPSFTPSPKLTEIEAPKVLQPALDGSKYKVTYRGEKLPGKPLSQIAGIRLYATPLLP